MTYDFENAQIAALYEDVPPEQLARLQTFRERHPYRTAEIRGTRWSYLDVGQGKRALLLLAGGTAIAELSFQTIEHLAERYRVIAPDYPPVGRLQALFADYVELLDRLGIEQFYLMGGSYGGWMAQSFVRHYADRIDKVVVSASGPPNPANSRQIAILLPLLRIAPIFLLRALANRSFSRLLGDADDTPERALVVALLREIMRYRLQRADVIVLLERLVDQTENETYTPHDLQGWHGRMLLLFGSDDPTTPPEKREAMRTLYPHAEVKLFAGGDHTFSLSHQQEYFEVIDAFLAGREIGRHPGKAPAGRGEGGHRGAAS